MSYSFTKLFSSITESTVWCEPLATRVVWITMLAMADRKGRVFASIPGLANRARVGLEETEAALARFLSPDRYSRTPDHEGRRIEPIDGGWRLLNYEKYRETRDDAARREYQRHWAAEKRRQKASTIDRSRPLSTQAEAEAEKPSPSPNGEGVSSAEPTAAAPGDKKKAIPDCPHEQIVAAYHELCPMLPRVRSWTKARRAKLNARWRDRAVHGNSGSGYATAQEGLAYWRRLFEWIAESKFLTGQVPGRDSRAPFIASLPWLVREENFFKVIEENFHRD